MMAAWSRVVVRFEWSALGNPRVVGSNPGHVSDCPSIIPGQGG